MILYLYILTSLSFGGIVGLINAFLLVHQYKPIKCFSVIESSSSYRTKKIAKLTCNSFFRYIFIASICFFFIRKFQVSIPVVILGFMTTFWGYLIYTLKVGYGN